MSAAKPVPSPEGLNAEWYAFCRERELRFQRCRTCGRWRHPPRFLCPACGSGAFSWARSNGRGSIFTWTVTHQAIHPAYAGEVPYAVVVVETDEGVRVVGGVSGLDLPQLRLGLDTEVDWEERTAEIVLPVWRPSQRQAASRSSTVASTATMRIE
jgi:uncharacterized OB-fold protein